MNGLGTTSPAAQKAMQPRVTTRIPNSPGNIRSTAGGKAGSDNSKKNGCLKSSILSAYDLTVRDPPSYVTVTVGDQTVRTGPPIQRHRDRNSFKFSMSSSASSYQSASMIDTMNPKSNHVRIRAPLPALYQERALVQLVYEDDPSKNLIADYPLDQLKVGEKTWLILHLDPIAQHHPSPRENGDTKTSKEEESQASEEVGPTLRIQMTLEGPYRTEIAAVVNMCNAWFGVVDVVEDNVRQVLSKLPRVPLPDAKFVLIPAAPFLAFAVVSLPVVLGVLLIGLPMFLPLFVVVGTVALAVVAVGASVYTSTREGRTHLQSLLQPVAHTLLSTKSGQRLVYQTGPRPTPVNVAKVVMPEGIWGKLAVSLLIDAAGSATYLLPVVGEGFDIGWAPFQTILLIAMYDTTSPSLKYLSFMEEILPLTDIVPSATLGWLMEFAYPLAVQAIGLGPSSQASNYNNAPSTASSVVTTPMTPMTTPRT